MTQYLFDENGIRYRLYKSNPGKNFNWLFIPGGPGADSRYLTSLIDTIDVPGNQWLVDFPGNGDNPCPSDYNHNQWLDIFVPMVSRFKNVVIVGHSCGAQIPLLLPELEDQISGFIALNSTPSLWLEEAAKRALADKLPDLRDEMSAFTANPNSKTFETALAACMPYYFPAFSMERGQKLLLGLPFQFAAAGWWQQKAIEIAFSAKWIPQKVPMLVIGAAFDYITPYSIYENDRRFNRPNIKMVQIEQAGHLPWVEQPETVRSLFSDFHNSVSLA